MCKCGYFAHERKIHVTGPLYGYVFGNYAYSGLLPNCKLASLPTKNFM